MFETNTELISKKDLLAAYQISYGTLYRWKRQGLIPETWFIRKATVTGQETFFPKQEVTARVEQILSRGEAQSLDALADQLQKEASGQARLTVRTASSSVSFAFDHLKDITVTLPTGETVDITDTILNFCPKED